MTDALTPAARKHLRGLAHNRPVSMQIGKDGLSDGVLAKIDDLLSRRELIKLKSLDAAPLQKDDLAEAICRATAAAVVSVTGKTISLYRPSDTLPPNKRIHPPQ